MLLNRHFGRDAEIQAMDGLQSLTVEGLVKTLLEDYTDTDEARLAEYERTGHGISHEIALAWLQDLAEGRYRPCPK